MTAIDATGLRVLEELATLLFGKKKERLEGLSSLQNDKSISAFVSG
jgi:hypothetical protein